MRSEAAMTAAPRLRIVRPGEVSPAVARARDERGLRRTIAVLLASSLALTLIGLVMVLSASSVASYAQYGSSFFFFERQLVSAAIGVVAFVLLARLPYRAWQRLWGPLTAVAVVLLLFVLHPSAGVSGGGSARWVSLGPVTLQPSELAKLVTVAAASAILSRNIKHVNDPLRMVMPLMPVVGVIAILVMLQPDLGTTMVIVAIVFLLVFVSGVKWRPLAATLALGSATGLALIMSAAYRRERFLSFLHPWADPKNTGYQIVQSLMALGSGHWLGVGIGASRQKWMFVPNAHTDFIFAIMGEETGLVGEIVVLMLFAAFIFAGIRIAMKAPDVFGRLLAAGITGWIAFQAIVNMGSVTGLLPITGVPLPFVSYGGSSLVVSLMAVGVLVSIARATLEAASASRPASRRKTRRARAPARSRVAASAGSGQGASASVRARARESARVAGHPAGTQGRGP